MRGKLFALALAGILSTGAYAYDLNEGLVAYWSFDNCSAVDDSGNGHDGKIYGNLACVDGVRGKAFRFEWGNYIKTMDELKWNTNSFTVTGWIKPNFISGWIGFVSKGEDDELCSNKNSFNFEFLDGKGHVRFGEACWYDVYFSTEPMLEVNKYKFVTVTYDGKKLRFYSDGEFISETEVESSLSAESSPFLIGIDFGGGDNYFQGILDEIRVYNRALSEEEVKALYDYYTKG